LSRRTKEDEAASRKASAERWSRAKCFQRFAAKDLAATDALVWWCIWLHEDGFAKQNEGATIISNETIAKQIGRKRDAVNKAVRRLIKLGLLKRDAGGYPGRASTYLAKRPPPIDEPTPKITEEQTA